MHWLTIVTLALLFVFALLGWRAGLIRRVLELVGMVASVVLASHYGHLLAEPLQDITGLSERLAGPLGLIVLLVVLILVTRLLAWGLSKALRVSILGWVDRWGGGLLGLTIGLLVCSVLLMLVCRLPVEGDLAEQVERDPVTRFVHGAAPALYTFVVQDNGEQIERLWNRAKDSVGDLPDPGQAVDGVRDAVGEHLGNDGE